MEAHLATRRFYMACALTPSHKSTLPSPLYRLPSIVSSPPGPPSPLIGRSDSPVRHFPTPWQSCNRRTAWMDPIITPFWTEDEGPTSVRGCPCPLFDAIRAVLWIHASHPPWAFLLLLWSSSVHSVSYHWLLKIAQERIPLVLSRVNSNKATLTVFKIVGLPRHLAHGTAKKRLVRLDSVSVGGVQFVPSQPRPSTVLRTRKRHEDRCLNLF